MRESLPLSLVLRNRLRYALTRREVLIIVMRRQVEVDHKIRTDVQYPAGFQDVISIPRTDENFRLLYDTKGRFVLHRITVEEAQYKLCRVVQFSKAKRATIGHNPFAQGQSKSIPYIVTHDGRTIRFADPVINVNDTVKFNLKTQKIEGHYRFDIGQLAMITRGANMGRVGTIQSIERHPGSFDIVHMKDRKNQLFATRLQNVFVIGDHNKPAISLPKAKGVKLSILEEREQKEKAGKA